MIRGALIFAVGLAIGYSKAMSDVPEAREFLDALKKEWAEADKPKNTDDLRRQLGIDFLMTRLDDALPHAASIPDNEVLIRDEHGEIKLTMGDLRAPFSVLGGHTTHTTEGEPS